MLIWRYNGIHAKIVFTQKIKRKSPENPQEQSWKGHKRCAGLGFFNKSTRSDLFLSRSNPTIFNKTRPDPTQPVILIQNAKP